MITHKSIGYSGRLGNQMFQYAALKAVSLYTGFECYLPNNTTVKPDGAFDFTNNKWLEYKLDLLDCFEITTPILEKQVDVLFQEAGFLFDPSIYEIEDNTAIEGYFQSYRYFDQYKQEILNQFTFKPSILDKCQRLLQSYTNPVAIHIRRGDYVNHPAFWTITPEYLAAALQALPEGEFTYLIFSDDFEWCREVFDENFTFMEGNNQFEDLCSMSLCQHNIISNSSFSWWAAWLNQNPNKQVIAPSEWFTNKTSLTDLYPETWTVI